MTALDKRLTVDEKQKLENMFQGDGDRDASSKIRGFLFQDLVAIDLLLDDSTKYVCLEYLEDVDAFCEDGIIKIIQVKYYPNSSPAMKEIMTDLYYQYLRMDLLESKLEQKIQLVIHREPQPQKPNLKKMRTYFDSLKKEEPDEIEDVPAWLKKNVYKYSKKNEQKKALFDVAAHEKSVTEFLDHFEIIHQNDIRTFKDEIGCKLIQEFSDCDSYDDDEDKKNILLGLAISYMQKRYEIEHPEFEKIKVDKTEFIDYMEQTMQQKAENHITAYVTSCIWEQYASILTENPDLDDDYIMLLNQIAKNTQEWMSEMLSTEKGQFRLLNTISRESYDAIKKYWGFRTAQKITKIIRCSDNLQTFFFYLWKIMADLCMEKSDFCMDKDEEMLNPQTYIDQSVENYICVKFEGDCVKTSVILPIIRPGQTGRDYEHIASRMYRDRPQKWYMAGTVSGKKDYKYCISVIREEDSVVDMETDRYIVECMKCIEIDKGKWKNVESCDKCIFSNNCVEGNDC